ncbi:hypothetical protein [Burkholderia contaminans]|uniref:hypothetical protein n=1 Tax=Burkholderia contaminans TaxID=488447 RepID=UPI0009F72E9E|nr:hypothetical protein [Burkholderia contaminans]
MARKKVFLRTDLSSVESTLNPPGDLPFRTVDISRPVTTIIKFGPQFRGGRAKFDFGRWYGLGIDAITCACQQQIERFLAKQDAELEILTTHTYCLNTKGFLNYAALHRTALGRDLTLSDINRTFIDGYIASLNDGRRSILTQKSRYAAVRAVLRTLCDRGLIEEVRVGDDATFPRNPFPGAHKHAKGETPLSKSERSAFAHAVKTEAMRIFDNSPDLTSELFSYVVLTIALHTGRNTWPLLEMGRNCLRAHPKANTQFLVLYKRRGHSTTKVAIKADRVDEKLIESLPSIRPSVARLIVRAIELTEPLCQEAPEHLRDRVWLLRIPTGPNRGGIKSLSDDQLHYATKALVSKYNLTDTNGNPLKITVGRLRKTFVNRIFEILDGDIVATAAAAGDTVSVVDVNYLRPGEESQKNWKFLGKTLVQELLGGTVGATDRTPVGQCSDPESGDYAPKRHGEICMSFLNCLRCRNYVVTGDDLYRLFSFYWRILRERSNMPHKRWQRQFAHIVRLIDRDVIEHGITKKIFKRDVVEREKKRAQHNPHPFWHTDTILTDLANLAT